MERFAEEALVLSTLDYGDSDRIVTLFTEGRGKLTAFAAGARKSRRRFAGALEPFTWLRAQLVERRGDTFRLDAVDVRSSFIGIRQDLALIARALYCVELCRELVREREPHAALFAILRDYLEQLERRLAGPTSLIAFELEVLAQAGLMPRFAPCSLCGQDIGVSAQFDSHHGGAVCEGCSARSSFGLPVSAELLSALAGLQRGQRTPLAPDFRRRARDLLNHFIEHQVGKRLKSVGFMAQVGLD